jgi:hypothetical protein
LLLIAELGLLAVVAFVNADLAEADDLSEFFHDKANLEEKPSVDLGRGGRVESTGDDGAPVATAVAL